MTLTPAHKFRVGDRTWKDAGTVLDAVTRPITVTVTIGEHTSRSRAIAQFLTALTEHQAPDQNSDQNPEDPR